jgi:hypothetical protein
VVRRYFEVSNSLHRTMDATALGALFAPGCPCAAQARSVRRAAMRGEHFTGIAKVNALRTTKAGPGQIDVLADYDFGGGGVVDPTGHRVTTTPARRGIRWLFNLRRMHGRWLITRIEDVR